MKLTGGLKTDATFSAAYYDARLYQREPMKIVWRADITLTPGGAPENAGQTLALDLLRKMHSDALVKPCEKLVVEPDEPVGMR